MKLINIDSGQWTKVKNDHFDRPDIDSAATRLIERAGHKDGFANGYDYLNERDVDSFNAEIDRPCGNMTLY